MTENRETAHTPIGFYTVDDSPICYMYEGNTLSADAVLIGQINEEKYAELIVKYVNSHEALVGALKEIMRLVDRHENMNAGFLANIAEAALKHAGAL